MKQRISQHGNRSVSKLGRVRDTSHDEIEHGGVGRRWALMRWTRGTDPCAYNSARGELFDMAEFKPGWHEEREIYAQ